MQFILPSRKYVVMLTLFWIGALAVTPWLIIILRPVPVTTKNVVLAYLMIDSAYVLVIPLGYILLGAAETVYRRKGHVRTTARFLNAIGLFAFAALPFAMGLIWIYGGVVSGSYVTVLVAFSICVGAAFLALRMAKRAVAILLEDNGQ